MSYSAIVLDLDGTLLNSGKQVSDRNRLAVRTCYEKGIKIIYATARPPRSVRQFLPEELISIGAFVYYNGAQAVCSTIKTEWRSFWRECLNDSNRYDDGGRLNERLFKRHFNRSGYRFHAGRDGGRDINVRGLRALVFGADRAV
ncbi:HAD family hydrolase [Cohnella sp. GCM10020058]|uniref:HAD family hydrolase n=1 Tax=Cohnella sp. GCM10020058 TaxID=3317330 RepID=UPI0036336547